MVWLPGEASPGTAIREPRNLPLLSEGTAAKAVPSKEIATSRHPA